MAENKLIEKSPYIKLAKKNIKNLLLTATLPTNTLNDSYNNWKS
jgi:hypothetical protein